MKHHRAHAWVACTLLLAACESTIPGNPDRDRGGPLRTEGGILIDGGPAPGDGAPPAPTLVEVAHQRELRAVWVASVFNIDFPSKPGLTASAQQAELIEILDTLAALRFNAIIFQVRPEGDALYTSTLEPWSRYLTGSQGGDPGYDPLALLVKEAHARAIEVHAWFNPYRAKADKKSAAVAPHLSLSLAAYAYPYSTYLWMDPGAQAVADHTAAVVLDVVQRYDIDGVHFDDYFYPYPDGTNFPDGKSYDAYLTAGGKLARDDWRRDNVNRLVERISQEIAAAKPHVRFGISPFGIYRPGIPPGITGLDQYTSLFADPPLWKQRGWVDYLAPQLYWPSTQAPQAFGPLVEWWSRLPDAEVYTFPGHYLSQLGSSAAWSLGEFRTQMTLSRAQRGHGVLGNFFFSYVPLREDRAGIRALFRDELYPAPALPPPLVSQQGAAVEPPRVTISGSTVHLEHLAPGSIGRWVVYAEEGSGWRLHDVHPSSQGTITLTAGRWAISAAGRHGVESRGVLVTIP